MEDVILWDILPKTQDGWFFNSEIFLNHSFFHENVGSFFSKTRLTIIIFHFPPQKN
jgi:hypothetical protein